MLLDVMPGHGRDNIQHELEMGHADVCDPDPARLVDCVLDALRRSRPPERPGVGPDRFADTFAEALAGAGIGPSGPGPIIRSSCHAAPTPQEVH